MRKTADRLNVVLLIVGIIAVLTYPYLRKYLSLLFMSRYMIFHWYLLFPMLSFSIGYFVFRVALMKVIVVSDESKKILSGILYIVIIGYLLAAIVTCIHCYINFLPEAIGNPLLYWMAIIHEHCLLAFAVIGGLYAVTILPYQ